MTNRHTFVWSVDVNTDIESNRTNALRTISMRIRSMNEETEQFDGTLQTIGGDVFDLTNGKVSIMLDPD